MVTVATVEATHMPATGGTSTAREETGQPRAPRTHTVNLRMGHWKKEEIRLLGMISLVEILEKATVAEMGGTDVG